ncbi:hypothetical protein SDC9_169089 [bioreactor metagenome]|uniref:DUF4162 domain-containing protein n=1 Tax=bioreactor metagenome TaxID=1076179 RepID=A0A645G7E9_9ZZZZ
MGDDTPENLSARIAGEHKFSVRIAGAKADVIKAVKGISGIKYCEAVGAMEPGSFDYVIEAQTGIDIRKPLFYELASKSFPILMLKSFDINLEDIFLKLTGEEEKKEAKLQ